MMRKAKIVILMLLLVLTCVTVSAKDIYPIKTDVTLTYWVPLNVSPSATVKNLGETPLYQEIMKRTGIKVRFLHPAMGQETEKFNLMLASGELPDIIEWQGWLTYPGGPEKAIEDGFIVQLNSLIDKYSPNLKKVLRDKELNKMVRTDSGKYFVYPNVRGDEYLLVFTGPFIRKDWLDELGLQTPTTIDEWYTVLKAFKDKKKVRAPLTFRYDLWDTHNAFVGAFGATMGFYVNNGKIKYGPIQPEFKNFLTTFRKWYAEGLVDTNLPTIDQKILDGKMTSGMAGACISNTGNGIGKYLEAMQAKDPKYDLVAAPYPTLKKGQRAMFGQLENKYSRNGNAAITTKCKNPELAARFLDYGYGDEGHMLFNFGIPGVSYNMVNNYPKYTDLLMKNPKGLTINQAMGSYMRGHYNGPFVQDKRYLEQYAGLPQQKTAIDVWKKTDQVKHRLPPISPSPAESGEMAKVMNEVNIYRDEMILKFIMGTEPLEKFDEYVAQLKKLGIEKAIKINENALARYQKRLQAN